MGTPKPSSSDAPIEIEDSQTDKNQPMREDEEAKIVIDACRDGIEDMLSEKMSNNMVLSATLEAIIPIKESLARVIQSLSEIESGSTGYESSELYRSDKEPSAVAIELKEVSKLANEVEVKMNLKKEIMMKEKKELENSLMSLAEENQDIHSLLRIALVEKESMEKNLNGLNVNREQKGVVMKIAERGLQMVGFGFIRRTGAYETSPSDISRPSTSAKSDDGSECEAEGVSLASTMERIMTNLRLENAQLQRSLEESRSDSERLQLLAEKQAQQLAENALYIKQIEDREIPLRQNVEELSMEIEEAEEEIARWREACEIEVEAGMNVVKERDRMVAILKQELEKTKVALNISNGKLKLKEELAGAAMAAQAAAERSLYLADNRTLELRAQIEELAGQLVEAEKRGREQCRKGISLEDFDSDGIDYRQYFYTYKIFDTVDEATSWAKSVAMKHGFTLNISSIKKYGTEKLLKCSRGERYRAPRKIKQDDDLRKKTSTKACRCPFQIRAKQVIGTTSWEIRVSDDVSKGVHNHRMIVYPEGHRQMSGLSDASKKNVREMSEAQAKPCAILAAIKETCSLNAHGQYFSPPYVSIYILLLFLWAEWCPK